MPPFQHDWLPPWDERELLFAHFEELRVDQIRDFMRNRITGLSNNKPGLLKAVKDSLREVKVTWREFVEYLDSVELYRKQRVHLYQALDGSQEAWSAEALKAAIERSNMAHVWNANVSIAAPDELEPSSITMTDQRLEVMVIGRRTYRRRVRELEDKVDTPRDGLEVQLYERVNVRAWVRLELDLKTGALTIRASRLPTTGLQEELRNDSVDLLDWFPEDRFAPVNLAKAIATLHKTEGDTPHEARVQAVGYGSPTGLKSAVRSSAGHQGVTGHGQDVDDAVATLRESGYGEEGNFFFLPPNSGGPPGTNLESEVRVVVYADTGEVDFPRPMKPKELEHVLRRIRVLAT
jgi:hypothetical protein